MTPETIAELRERVRIAECYGGYSELSRAEVRALLDAAAERDALAAKVARVRALAAGMGVPRPGAGTDRDSSITRVTLRAAGHRILRALDEEAQP